MGSTVRNYLKELDWHDGNWNPVVKWARFSDEDTRTMVTVKIEMDDDPDLSFYGQFSDRWQHGAVKMRDGQGRLRIGWNYTYHSVAEDSTYFIPGYLPVFERVKEIMQHEHKSFSEAIRIARERTLEDMEGATGNKYDVFGVVVEVVTDDSGEVEVGSASVWGVTVDHDDDPYLNDVIDEELHEAMHEARIKTGNVAGNYSI